VNEAPETCNFSLWLMPIKLFLDDEVAGNQQRSKMAEESKGHQERQRAIFA